MDKNLQTGAKKIWHRHGLVIGKFMPLHQGHVQLIEFAKQHCEFLTVLVCSLDTEPIPWNIRYQRTKDAFATNPYIDVEHTTVNLPSESQSSRKISKIWSKYLSKKYPDVDVIIGSEEYIHFVAEYMNITSIIFDIPRTANPVSATMIRNDPFKYWDFIPEHVKGYFTKKVCVVGTESTGKTTLVSLLAENFQTYYIEEMVRYVVEKTEEVVFEDLKKIAEFHAKTLKKKQWIGNKILFIDTDVNITKSYAHFLFQKELEPKLRIEKANTFDLYLFLDADCEYVQDGTRLDKKKRMLLDASHKEYLKKAGITYHVISWKTWRDRFNNACNTINKKYFS